MIQLNKRDATDYRNWLGATRGHNYNEAKKYEDKAIAKDVNGSMILCSVQIYIDRIAKYFSNKSLPIVIVTALGKHDATNSQTEWVLGYFRYRMTSMGYTTLAGKRTSPYRELNAVADIKMIRGAEDCIAFGGSTFSQFGNLLRTSNNIKKQPCSIIKSFDSCLVI